nr:S1/P1 nuclease [Teredinibacter haidensis]
MHFILTFAVIFGASNLHAWNVKGHSVIALKVYESLPKNTAELYQKRAALLYKHYGTKGHLRNGGDQCVRHHEICFLGYWFDTVKGEPLNKLFQSSGGRIPAAFEQYENQITANWHYHNVFYHQESAEFFPNCARQNDGMLLKILPVLEDAMRDSKTPSEQALLLSFAVHLLSDLHQPLHTITSVDDSCNHDRGGNNQCMDKGKSKCKQSLHNYWDAGAGLFVQSGAETLPKTTQITGIKEFPYGRWLAENSGYASSIYHYFNELSGADYQIYAQKTSFQRSQLAVERISEWASYFLTLEHKD